MGLSRLGDYFFKNERVRKKNARYPSYRVFYCLHVYKPFFLLLKTLYNNILNVVDVLFFLCLQASTTSTNIFTQLQGRRHKLSKLCRALLTIFATFAAVDEISKAPTKDKKNRPQTGTAYRCGKIIVPIRRIQ